MSNMNEKHMSVKGRNPNAVEILPSFASATVSDAAIWIEDGQVVSGHSSPEKVTGNFSNSSATGLNIVSDEKKLNVLVVKGSGSDFVLSDSVMELSGYGCSDFTSIGAATLAVGGAKLKLEKVNITTHDAGRPAAIVTEGSTLKIYDSKLATHGGKLPEDYVPVIGPEMMEPPFPLGLSGNCRTLLVMDNSEAFLYNCDVYADSWAALSTDSAGSYVRLEANNCRVKVAGNGYCVYADKCCHVFVNDSTLVTGNVAGIQDGNADITFVNTTAVCGKNGFLLHGGKASYADLGLVELTGGRIECGEAVFLAKSTNVDIYVNGTELVSNSGVLINAIETDDEFYHSMRTTGDKCYGIQATFENLAATGDILYCDKDRKMRISLVNSSIEGAIKGGPVLCLYEGARWKATADSEVVFDKAPGLDSIDAAAGVTISASASDGSLQAGEYVLSSGGRLAVTR
ncbi:MAG: hypothetical protein HGA22_01880 [Clostridiales bacterium]|nr:hypothetical protein [Clostridiales bacterium]